MVMISHLLLVIRNTLAETVKQYISSFILNKFIFAMRL